MAVVDYFPIRALPGVLNSLTYFCPMLCYSLSQSTAQIVFLLNWMFIVHKCAKFKKQMPAATTGVSFAVPFSNLLMKLRPVFWVIKPEFHAICPTLFYKASVRVAVLNFLAFMLPLDFCVLFVLSLFNLDSQLYSTYHSPSWHHVYKWDWYRLHPFFFFSEAFSAWTVLATRVKFHPFGWGK